MSDNYYKIGLTTGRYESMLTKYVLTFDLETGMSINLQTTKTA